MLWPRWRLHLSGPHNEPRLLCRQSVNFSKGRASRTVAGSGRLPILLIPCYPHATVPYVPLSDPEVIHRVLSEKKQLFELLLRRYNQRLYRAGCRAGRSGSRGGGHAECLVKAYEHLA